MFESFGFRLQLVPYRQRLQGLSSSSSESNALSASSSSCAKIMSSFPPQSVAHLPPSTPKVPLTSEDHEVFSLARPQAILALVDRAMGLEHQQAIP